jgi:hypothetical protein
MPLFSNPKNPNPGAWEPEAAEGRLAKTVGASEAGVFTSDLSVSEYVLLGEAGFEPPSWSAPRSTTSACRSGAGTRTRSCRS